MFRWHMICRLYRASQAALERGDMVGYYNLHRRWWWAVSHV